LITFFYTIGIHLYTLVIRLASLWNIKARLWINGRKQVWQQLSDFQINSPKKEFTIWIHCASLGEFEQGRPVIKKLRRQFPLSKLVLTFFSPSGYEIRKQYDQVDLVCYLPVDTPQNAQRFIQQLQPDLAIFVKYEFWHHYLHQLKKNRTPVVLISAIFRSNQLFFKSYGFWYRRLLQLFDHLFVQDEVSVNLLKEIGITNYTLAGDTRVDRVLSLAKQAPEFPLIAQFVKDSSIWVAGSTWPTDEQFLFPFWEKHLPENWRIILAPHEIGAHHIAQIEALPGLTTIRYSELLKNQDLHSTAKVLIIDNIGMLSALYQYGDIAYIGGGFGKAIHNLLEPIAFRLPVIFGPKHEKFHEALALKASGGGFALEQSEDIVTVFQQLQEKNAHQEAAQQAYNYLVNSKGSTDKILTYVAENFTGSL